MLCVLFKLSKNLQQEQSPKKKIKQEPQIPKAPVKQEPKVPVKEEPEKKVDTIVYELDHDKLTMTRISNKGPETVALEKGQGAFLIAKFKSEEVESELPNLFLDLGPVTPAASKKKEKKPAKPKAKAKTKSVGKAKASKTKKKPLAKKPVAADAPGGVAPPEAPADDPAPAGPNIGELEVVSAPEESEKDWSVMWYKNNTSIGIRQKFEPFKQIFSFGGARVEKSQAAMKEIGNQVVQMLKEGKTEAEAKAEAIRLTFAD